MNDHAVIMSKPPPQFGGGNKIDGGADPLLLDAQRRDLDEAGGVNARNETLIGGPPSRRSAQQNRW